MEISDFVKKAREIALCDGQNYLPCEVSGQMKFVFSENDMSYSNLRIDSKNGISVSESVAINKSSYWHNQQIVGFREDASKEELKLAVDFFFRQNSKLSIFRLNNTAIIKDLNDIFVLYINEIKKGSSSFDIHDYYMRVVNTNADKQMLYVACQSIFLKTAKRD